MKKALELGCGNLSEANSLTDYSVTAIDKKITGTPLSHVTTIEGDYFNIDLKTTFDLIYANYTLCFNKRSRIESRLPYILLHLTNGGTLIIKDFAKDEKTVTKRTNLDAEWFFKLLRRHVGKIYISRERVHEKEYNHMHEVLTIQGVKTATEEIN